MKHRISRILIAAFLLGLLPTFHLSVPTASAATDTRYTLRASPNPSLSIDWATQPVPGIFIFDPDGNAWGILNASSGQCIVKIIPNSSGTSGTVTSIYGAFGSCNSLAFSEGVLAYEKLGRTGTRARSLAWLDSDHLAISTDNGIYSWDISVTPDSTSLVKITNFPASKIAIDSNQNLYLVIHSVLYEEIL